MYAVMPEPVRRGPPALELHKVSMSLPHRGVQLPVLSELSIVVPHATWATIIGPTGCGKTTALRIAAGLLQPHSGRVLLGGHARNPLGHVAYMPQSDTLLPWRTVLGNTLLAADADGRPRGPARADARELLDRFGLGSFEDAYPSELSGGMRQRVALIRSFLTGRDVLLLDEPLGALDALSRLEAQAWLLNVWRTFRKTIVFVTHDVEEAALLSDTVHVLSPRPAHAQGTLHVALKRPRNRLSSEMVKLRAQLLSALGGEGAHA